MKKFIVVACFIAFIALIGFGLEYYYDVKDSKTADDNSTSTSSSIDSPYASPNVNIYIPEKFYKTSTDTNSTVYVCDDATIIANEDFFQSYCNSLETYVSASETTYSDTVNVYNRISKENITVNRLNTTILEFSYELNVSNDTIKKTCLVAFYNDSENSSDQVYILTCKADTENYELYKNDFMRTIKSLELI